MEKNARIQSLQPDAFLQTCSSLLQACSCAAVRRSGASGSLRPVAAAWGCSQQHSHQERERHSVLRRPLGALFLSHPSPSPKVTATWLLFLSFLQPLNVQRDILHGCLKQGRRALLRRMGLLEVPSHSQGANLHFLYHHIMSGETYFISTLKQFTDGSWSKQ